MGNFGKIALGAVGGFILATIAIVKDIDDGKVVYDNDDIYVKASDNKTLGWSFARVAYKNGEEK